MIHFTLPKNINNRSVYIDKVGPFMNSNLIKVFTGQRRVGKSYLLYQIIQEVLKYNENATILYINKEDLAFSEIKMAQDLNDYVQIHKSKTENPIYLLMKFKM